MKNLVKDGSAFKMKTMMKNVLTLKKMMKDLNVEKTMMALNIAGVLIKNWINGGSVNNLRVIKKNANTLMNMGIGN